MKTLKNLVDVVRDRDNSLLIDKTNSNSPVNRWLLLGELSWFKEF
jgi:hypothetical protein